MCLYVSSDIETCQADLVVYKTLATDNLSPWYKFAYRPNVLVRHRKALAFVRHRKALAFAGMGWGTIEEGLHAFLTKKAATEKKVDLDVLYNPKSYKVVKMVIPKGAKVAYGTGQEIVSTSIRSGSLRVVKH